MWCFWPIIFLAFCGCGNGNRRPIRRPCCRRSGPPEFPRMNVYRGDPHNRCPRPIHGCVCGHDHDPDPIPDDCDC